MSNCHGTATKAQAGLNKLTPLGRERTQVGPTGRSGPVHGQLCGRRLFAQTLHISDIAVLLRTTLKAIDEHWLRSFVSLLQAEPDMRNITLSVPALETDVLLSSWAALPIYPSDFGARLGKPESLSHSVKNLRVEVCSFLPHAKKTPNPGARMV